MKYKCSNCCFEKEAGAKPFVCPNCKSRGTMDQVKMKIKMKMVKLKSPVKKKRA